MHKSSGITHLECNFKFKENDASLNNFSMTKKTPPVKSVPVPGSIPETPPPYNPENFIPEINDADILPEEDPFEKPLLVEKPASGAGPCNIAS